MTSIRRSVGPLLLALVTVGAMGGPAWAQNRTFVGAPAFTVNPRIVGGQNLGNPTIIPRGNPQTDPQLVTLPGGFKHSNVNLAYTVPNGDLNKNLTLVWTIRRPFTRAQAGNARIVDNFDGYVEIPLGGRVTSLTMTTREVAIPASMMTITVPVGTWAVGNNPFAQGPRQTALYLVVPTNAGLLEQSVRMELRTTQVGTFEIGLQDSAETELFDESGGLIVEPCVAAESESDTQCRADLTGDGQVDDGDGAMVLAAQGLCTGDEGFDPALDIIEDGCIDAADFDAVLASAGLAPVVIEESVPAVP